MSPSRAARSPPSAPICEANAGTEVRDVTGLIVTPGLIDLHTHVYWGGTSLGIDAEDFCRTVGRHHGGRYRQRGPRQFPRLPQACDRAQRRCASSPICMSPSPASTPSRTRSWWARARRLRLMAPREAVEVADDNRDVIVGIKVRVGLHASGTHGERAARYRASGRGGSRHAADGHIDDPPPSYEDVIARLRPGDVLTHAFRPFPNSPADRAGHGEAGRARGAEARRAFRHRPRQGLVRLQDGARHAGERLRARHHLVGCACALHQRPGLRSGDDAVEISLPRHAARSTSSRPRP